LSTGAGKKVQAVVGRAMRELRQRALAYNPSLIMGRLESRRRRGGFDDGADVAVGQVGAAGDLDLDRNGASSRGDSGALISAT